MCLGIPMKIVRLDGQEGEVEAGHLRRRANFSLLKEVRMGEYVLVHAGFAIERVKEKEARATLKMLKDVGYSG